MDMSLSDEPGPNRMPFSCSAMRSRSVLDSGRSSMPSHKPRRRLPFRATFGIGNSHSTRDRLFTNW